MFFLELSLKMCPDLRKRWIQFSTLGVNHFISHQCYTWLFNIDDSGECGNWTYLDVNSWLWRLTFLQTQTLHFTFCVNDCWCCHKTIKIYIKWIGMNLVGQICVKYVQSLWMSLFFFLHIHQSLDPISQPFILHVCISRDCGYWWHK